MSTPDFFRARLDTMIDMNHPLVILAKRLPWSEIEPCLARTLAVNLKAIKPTELETIITDSTVQEKAIAHPTDSQLLDVARRKLVQLARHTGISLRQTFEKEGKILSRQASGYAHARQFNRLNSQTRHRSNSRCG